MGLVQAPSGSLLMFADGVFKTPQLAGTVDIFERTILNTLTIHRTATLQNNGKLRTRIEQPIYTNIDDSSPVTTNLTTAAQWQTTGSFIAINTNSNNHTIQLSAPPSPSDGYMLHVYKSRANTATVTITDSTNKINSYTSWYTTDYFASIELVYNSFQTAWIVKSKHGNWNFTP